MPSSPTSLPLPYLDSLLAKLNQKTETSGTLFTLFVLVSISSIVHSGEEWRIDLGESQLKKFGTKPSYKSLKVLLSHIKLYFSNFFLSHN